MAAVLVLVTCGVASALTPFQQDVNDTIDAWLAYARVNNGLSASNQAAGLVLVALLEKHPIGGGAPNGYTTSEASDQCLERNAVSALIQNGNHVGRSSFYAYVDGIDLLALSLYAKTGGPDPHTTPEDCTNPNVDPTLSVRDAIDKLVDRVVANQDTSATLNSGFWGYTVPGDDSSTTQFAAGGLAAARNFYLATSDPGTRVPLINAALSRTKDGYAANQQISGTEGGWGYRPPEGYAISYQQTGSGLWASELGGALIDDPTVQRALRWQLNHFNYENILYAYNSWSYSYGYYIFSSCKAYLLLEVQGPPAAGNLGPADLGSLPADPVQGRLARRNPNTDVDARLAFPGGGMDPGVYSAETVDLAQRRWYYDYAYTIMSRQQADGSYAEPYSAWEFWSNQAYYELCLERSLGGTCVDSDEDGVCDDADNCVRVSNPPTCQGGTNDGATCHDVSECPSGTCAQTDTDADGIGDLCDCGNDTIDPPEECDGTIDALCPGECTPPGSADECRCPIVCGNDRRQGNEGCDGTDDAACPGECGAPGSPNQCLCPGQESTCGNDAIDPGEQCDGTSDAACPGACAAPGSPGECHCPAAVACGNNVVEGSEECDGTSDANCPGRCFAPGDARQCTCNPCGNGILDPGESCDDGNRIDGSCRPDKPQKVLDACRNDCSAMSCDDPSRIRFGTDGQLDSFHFHARIEPSARRVDATSNFGVKITRPGAPKSGVVYSAVLSRGVDGGLRYVDRAAIKSGGIAKVRIRQRSANSYAVTVLAYGDLSQAGPDMTVTVELGAGEWSVTGTWKKTFGGWVFRQ